MVHEVARRRLPAGRFSSIPPVAVRHGETWPSGCSSVWLERPVRGREGVRSNRTIPTDQRVAQQVARVHGVHEAASSSLATLTMVYAKRVKLEDRFWSGVDHRGYDECWPWRRGTNQYGYGNFQALAGELGLTRNRMLKAHRVAFRLVHGRWPEPHGLHGCDNPGCCNAVNPEHVHEGDHSANMRERAQRQRWNQAGQLNSRAKLTTAQIAEIRERYATSGITQTALAAEYEVSRQAIGFIVHERTYKPA